MGLDCDVRFPKPIAARRHWSQDPVATPQEYSWHVTPRGNPVPDTLFVFIDESGNFDFSEKGTTHFVKAGVAALAPLNSAAEMQALRYQLLAEGEKCDRPD